MNRMHFFPVFFLCNTYFLKSLQLSTLWIDTEYIKYSAVFQAKSTKKNVLNNFKKCMYGRTFLK